MSAAAVEAFRSEVQQALRAAAQDEVARGRTAERLLAFILRPPDAEPKDDKGADAGERDGELGAE